MVTRAVLVLVGVHRGRFVVDGQSRVHEAGHFHALAETASSSEQLKPAKFAVYAVPVLKTANVGQVVLPQLQAFGTGMELGRTEAHKLPFMEAVADVEVVVFLNPFVDGGLCM